MATTDTNVSTLVINVLSREQYESSSKSQDELYLVPYESPSAEELGCPTAAEMDSKADLSGAEFTGNLKTKGSFGTSVTVPAGRVDLSLGTVFMKTVTEAITFTFDGAMRGAACSFTLLVANGGAHDVEWPETVRWPGGKVPSLTASGVDLLLFVSPDGGNSWYGAVLSANAG